MPHAMFNRNAIYIWNDANRRREPSEKVRYGAACRTWMKMSLIRTRNAFSTSPLAGYSSEGYVWVTLKWEQHGSEKRVQIFALLRIFKPFSLVTDSAFGTSDACTRWSAHSLSLNTVPTRNEILESVE